VPAIFGRVERDHHFVPFARADLVVATGAPVRLVGLVRLHVPHFDPAGLGPVVLAAHRGNAAHSTSNATTKSAIATSAMSLRRRAWGRNGLKPTQLR
jgi:hypothetical protein